MQRSKSIDIKLFSLFLKCNRTLCDHFKGVELVHNNSICEPTDSFGLGKIIKIYKDINGEMYIKIKFNREYEYNLITLYKYFDKILIHDNLLEIIKEFQDKLISKNAIQYYNADLISIYNLVNVNEIPEIIYDLLIKLLLGDIIEDRNIEKWIEHTRNHHIFLWMAKYFEERILRNDAECWHNVKAGKYFRKAHLPSRTLNLPENIQQNDNKYNSALFTNRGAAYCDLKEWGLGEECAIKAIKYDNESHRAWRLMGRISKKEEHFKLADELEEGNPSKTNVVIRDMINIVLDDNKLKHNLLPEIRNLMIKYPDCFNDIKV